MAEELKSTEIQTVRIAQEIPVIFIDSVMSHSYAFGVSKLFLARTDPPPSAEGPSKDVVVLQVVMPTDNFVRTVAFLEHRLKTMVEVKAITQEDVDTARQFWVDYKGSEQT